eukprot:3927089-Alexandrium_andersonii.AAC.1
MARALCAGEDVEHPPPRRFPERTRRAGGRNGLLLPREGRARYVLDSRRHHPGPRLQGDPGAPRVAQGP